MQDILAEARNTISRIRQQKENPDRETLLVPLVAVADILRLLASHTNGPIFHIFPVLDENLRARAFELHIWRQLARRGNLVSRIYAVPHEGFGKTVLDAAIAEDVAHRVEARVVTLSTIPPDRLTASVHQSVFSSSGFVFRSNGQISSEAGEGTQDWTLSVGKSDLVVSSDLWDTLIQVSHERTLTSKLIDLEEPLVLSADLINGVANVLCSGDHVDKDNCSWYHGTWQYLRLLDLVSTPTWHDLFYRSAFQRILEAKPRARVLISGTADYSLLAYLFGAARRSGATPDIVVLDQCATPLFACRWFSKHFGTNVTTVQANVFDAKKVTGGGFDLVTSDAFLTRFSEAGGTSVAKIWFDVLKQGGRAVTTVRLHENAVEVRDEERAVLDFVTRARVRLPRWKQFLRQSSQYLYSSIEHYARKMVSNRIGGEHDIVRSFEAHRFGILSTEVAKVPGELYPTIYLRLEAERK